MKKLLILICFIVVVCACLVGSYFYLISSPSKTKETISFYVEEGQTYNTISTNLKKKNLIRNELAYKIYLKIHPETDLEYGEYRIDTNLSVKELIDVLKKGSISLANTKSVTFIEGKNMRNVISVITQNFNISESEVLSKLNDKEYLDKLIEKYWFITEEVKNDKIYYSLEGYLYPDTYEFYTNASVEDIFEKMLDNMESKLEEYKSEIESSEYSFHEMITLASIIEHEAGTSSDRRGVAGVFYNRLEDNWSLGSDVTTYYSEKIDNYSRDLYNSELNECNDYNTRSSCMAGKLPVGPICNPSLNSLVAAIEPEKHDYYYFVADKNGKTYFNKTYSGHEQEVARLKREGLWIEYEE